MTRPARQPLIDLLPRPAAIGPRSASCSGRWAGPGPRPAHLDALEELIAEFGPDIAARVVVEAYRGGLGG
jgi:hypothetical protein